MIFPVDAVLRREAVVHNFAWSCERCAHFDAAAVPAPRPSAVGPGTRCSLGFPHEPHVDAAWDAVEIAFCKSFELA